MTFSLRKILIIFKGKFAKKTFQMLIAQIFLLNCGRPVDWNMYLNYWTLLVRYAWFSVWMWKTKFVRFAQLWLLLLQKMLVTLH